MRILIIDGHAMTSKNAMYTHLGRVFQFPEHFGNNLDALWDILTEETEPTVIYFKEVAKLIEQMDGYGEKVIQVFQNLEQMTDNYTVHFYPDGKIEENKYRK